MRHGCVILLELNIYVVCDAMHAAKPKWSNCEAKCSGLTGMGNRKSKPVSPSRARDVSRKDPLTRTTPRLPQERSRTSVRTADENGSVLFSYVAVGGGEVEVPKSVNPYKELSVAVSATNAEIKEAFKQCVNCHRRQKRVMASLAYHMITSQERDGRYSRNGNYYQIKKVDDIFTLAAIGHTNELRAVISRDMSLLDSVDNWGRTVLYLAARCGFYDTTEALLKMGAAVNRPQANGSTPLHGAAYYDQEAIVKLLLIYGADPDAKNDWGNNPDKETASDTICRILANHGVDGIAAVASCLVSKGLGVRIRLLRYEDKVIGKEIVRNVDALDPETRRIWMDAHSQWEVAWHGTKADHLESIFYKGLLPSGSKSYDGTVIKPPRGHYRLSEEHFGIADWARAIFVSPDVLYASHVCYSERVISEDKQWCVLVKVRVKPSSYTSHDQTTLVRKEPIDGEPETAEYRINVQSELESSIMRVESQRNVVTSSILFVKLNFLESAGDKGLTYAKLQSVLMEAEHSYNS